MSGASIFQITGGLEAWNEWIVLFAMYLGSLPSARTGQPVQARTVESYISLLKGHVSFQYDFDMVERAPRLKRLLTEMKHNDPLGLWCGASVEGYVGGICGRCKRR